MKIKSNTFKLPSGRRLPLTQFAILSALLVIVAFVTGFRPVGGEAQTIVIPEGASKVDVAKLLNGKHIIRSETHFLAAVVLSGTDIKAGTYTLDPKNNLATIVTSLYLGPQKKHITLLIPEGWRKEQIAQELTKKGLDGTSFLALVQDKEGYLFPDTYFFPPDATPQEILDKISQNYSKRTASLNVTREQLTLASIIEREAKRDDERALIAGIYMNRLKRGMPLEADPTVQYAKESNQLAAGKTIEQFWQPITMADYRNVDSPYNTYIATSYPPGPIANPGLKSIQAAINPKTTDAIFFFHTSSGAIVTSKTLEEHNANKRRYL